MAFELLVNFEEFWLRLRQDIAAANKAVLIQTFAFEGDSIGEQLAAALLACRASDKRILADSFTRVVFSDKCRFWPASLLDQTLKDELEKTSALRDQLQSAGIEIRF